MKKLLGRISKLKGQRSITKMHELTKRTSQEDTTLNIDSTIEKSNSLDSRNQTPSPMESGELNINGDDDEILNQKDSRQSANVYSIENYAELLLQKLRPLSSNNTSLSHYASDDLEK